MYVVAASKSNAHPGVIFEFLFTTVKVLESYFGAEFDENAIKNNFVVIYELLDEMMDFGYPQIVSPNLLSKYIKVGTQKIEWVKHNQEQHDTITKEITGAIDWREDGKFKYRKNEVWIDILESVNLLKSVTGETLRKDVTGRVVMKTFLSGMPECKFGINDKLVMDKEGQGSRRKGAGGIAIEDLRFHRCVRLGKFDTERTVSFIPPDGEFDLMSYRVTNSVNPPFTVTPIVQEVSKIEVAYEVQVKAHFSKKLNATNVILRIPTPDNTSKHKINTNGKGRAKYDPENNCIEWKIKSFPGDGNYTLRATVSRIALMNAKTWSRPPITMDFQVPMFTSSGMHVRFLKVTEKSNYPTVKWVRYITKAGQYQIRI